MPSRNHNKVHGKHRGRSNFRPFTVTLYINTNSKYMLTILIYAVAFLTFGSELFGNYDGKK